MAWRVANVTICTRRLAKNVSGPTRSASVLLRTSVAKAASISWLSRARLDPFMQVLELALKLCLVVLPDQPIYPGCCVRPEFEERLFE
jgi:hypothetical protein